MVGTPSTHTRLAVLASAVVFLWGVPVLAQETVVVRVKLIQGAVSTDPLAPIWNTIPATEFPMSPQVHWPKRILQVSVKSIKVRGVHNTKQIAFLLEYADPTQDPADAAALEFMVGDKKAQGFGTLKKQAQQDVQAKGVWKDEKTKGRFKERKLIPRKDAKGEPAKDSNTGDPLFDEETKVVEQDVTGVWRVVFIRALTTSDPNDAQFQPGTFPNIAFAVWDGKKLESGDLKESGS